MAERYRKKPVIVEAIQFDGTNVAEIWDAFGADGIYGPTEKNPDYLILTTVHGDPAPARIGDWVIPDGKPGTFYPCKPEIFAATYEPADPPLMVLDATRNPAVIYPAGITREQIDKAIGQALQEHIHLEPGWSFDSLTEAAGRAVWALTQGDGNRD